ncbi:hypothetical protein [Paenibacillus sp. J22TS3]|uniref:hypothetical protein n=1 Tax=Paenibacillus sp. J22TS3 TaxID=2807192 RepID=UPI001B180ABE|nr:hypothetical protein [Paenibacillus sp. J22TS3]GIP21496.1 hypothetical protein J22TS3_17710 [Paenibacillus sp. J22TS3]
MTISWIITGLGIILTLLGYYLTPDAWGYGLSGFGLALVLCGAFDLLRGISRQQKY